MKFMMFFIGLCMSWTMSGQELHINPAGLWFVSIPGTSYTLLTSSRAEGLWTESLIASTASITRISLVFSNSARFFRLKPPQTNVPTEIKLVSDPYVERLMTLKFALPTTTGGWKIIVRTNGSTFLSWSGTVRTNTLHIQEDNIDRYGYPNIPNGFDVEVWVTNATVRTTNVFHLENRYRLPRSGYESTVVEQGGAITAIGNARFNANLLMGTALDTLAEDWKFFDFDSMTSYLDPTTWDTTSASDPTFQRYVNGAFMSKPSHVFYLGKTSPFIISNRLTFALFVSSNAQSLAQAAAGPTLSIDELEVQGKYARFAAWVDPQFKDEGDLTDDCADAITRFLSLASEYNRGIRRYTFREVLSRVSGEYPGITFGSAGSPDADLDGYY